MKHPNARIAVFLLLFLAITAGIGAAQEQQPSSAPVTASIAGATIAEWNGNLQLSLPGHAPSTPVRGEQLPAGTVVDTGNGRLLLRLSDGSELLVRSHTRLQLQQPSLSDPSYFQLLLGKIRALITKRTGGAVPFELGTPSAVIAVRGTQFDVEVNSHNVTEVDVVDGLVEVYGRKPGGASVLLEPGFSTRVGMDGDPEQPEPTNEMRPEVEISGREEKESGEKTEMQREFERAEVDQKAVGEIEAAESAEISEMREIREVSDQAAAAAEVEVNLGSEPPQ